MEERDGAGVERLSRALRDRSETYGARLALDLALVAALLRAGRLAAARRALDEHRTSLLAYASELERALADAVVEREAETVVASVASVASVAPAEVGVPRPPRRLRRSLASSLAAVALAAAIVAPQLRAPPTDLGASVETAARRELIDARHRLADLQGAGDEVLAAEALAVHRRALALPPEVLAVPDVRVELVALLEEQVVVLAGVPSPQAQELLAEVRALWSVLVVGPGFLGPPLVSDLAPLPFAAATGLPSATLPDIPGDAVPAPPSAAVPAPAVPAPAGSVPAAQPDPASLPPADAPPPPDAAPAPPPEAAPEPEPEPVEEPQPSDAEPAEPEPSEPAPAEGSPSEPEPEPAPPTEPEPIQPHPAPAPEAPPGLDPPTGLQEGEAPPLLMG